MGHEAYDEWHLDLGHSVFRITVTMAGYGSDLDAAEAFLDGFAHKHPENGPVVSQDTRNDSIAVTFAVNASDSGHAMKLATVIWASGGEASGLAPGRVLKVETERVDDDRSFEPAESGERVPA